MSRRAALVTLIPLALLCTLSACRRAPDTATPPAGYTRQAYASQDACLQDAPRVNWDDRQPCLTQGSVVHGPYVRRTARRTDYLGYTAAGLISGQAVSVSVPSARKTIKLKSPSNTRKSTPRRRH